MGESLLKAEARAEYRLDIGKARWGIDGMEVDVEGTCDSYHCTFSITMLGFIVNTLISVRKCLYLATIASKTSPCFYSTLLTTKSIKQSPSII